jgi:hypothetical protein
MNARRSAFVADLGHTARYATMIAAGRLTDVAYGLDRLGGSAFTGSMRLYRAAALSWWERLPAEDGAGTRTGTRPPWMTP